MSQLKFYIFWTACNFVGRKIGGSKHKTRSRKKNSPNMWEFFDFESTTLPSARFPFTYQENLVSKMRGKFFCQVLLSQNWPFRAKSWPDFIFRVLFEQVLKFLPQPFKQKSNFLIIQQKTSTAVRLSTI